LMPETGEVDDERADRVLPAELISGQMPPTEGRPETRLSLRGRSPKSAGELGRHTNHSTGKNPRRIPSPARRERVASNASRVRVSSAGSPQASGRGPTLTRRGPCPRHPLPPSGRGDVTLARKAGEGLASGLSPNIPARHHTLTRRGPCPRHPLPPSGRGNVTLAREVGEGGEHREAGEGLASGLSPNIPARHHTLTRRGPCPRHPLPPSGRGNVTLAREVGEGGEHREPGEGRAAEYPC
jgi:hypothetical protein